MLLEKTLAILAHIVTRHMSFVLAGLVLVLGAAFWLCKKVHMASRWVVRKGACPGCGSALFGTTSIYQHLPGLDLVYPESPYLYPAYDHAKVTALQQQYHMERADD